MTDLAELKKSFEERLSKLTHRAVKIDKDLSQAGDNDWAEHAVETANDEVLEEIGDSTVNEIRQIKLALEQIDDGTYGVCRQCKGHIAKERLAALPFAVKCIDCA